MAFVDDAVSYVSSAGLLNGSSQFSSFDPYGVFDVYGSYLNRMNEVAESNNAASAAEAEKLRTWQEKQNRLAMEFNSREAAKNRDWQEMMSNTAHQREVADLVAAGLNPILSAMGGNGAAVTSGATASGVTSAGAKGDVDMSRNQGIASLLGSMLTAQTNLMNTMVTAQNNMAIAEKNNEMNKLIAMMSNENQYNIAKIYESLGMFQSLTGANATKAASYLSYLASIYGSDMAYAIQKDFPNSWPAIIERLLDGLGIGPSDAGSSIREAVDQAWSNLGRTGENAVSYFLPGLGAALARIKNDKSDSYYGARGSDRFSKWFQDAMNYFSRVQRRNPRK